jgi:hypothetical protein
MTSSLSVPAIVPKFERHLIVVIRYMLGEIDRRPLWELALETRKVRSA